MTVKKEILEMLRNGTSLQEIRGKFRSKSQLYEALTEYLRELVDKVEATRTFLDEKQAELRETGAENERSVIEKKELKNEVEALRTEKEALSADVESLRKEHNDLQRNVEEIRSRGFTRKVVMKLKTALDKDGATVAALLETHEKACELQKEVAFLTERKNSLTSEIGLLDTKRQKLKKMLTSEENRLDLLEAQIATFQDVAGILKLAIKEGYSPEELKALLLWLRKMEIEGEPTKSISHFLQCLAEAKKLVVLNNKVRLAENRLNELTRAEAEMRAKAEIAQNIVVKAIAEVRANAEQMIASAGIQGKDEVIRVASESKAEIKALANTASAVVVSSIAETGKLQEQKTRLESLLQPAQALIGIIDPTNNLQAVQPLLVVTLLERFVLYCEQRYPNAFINALYNSCTYEFMLNPPLPTPIRISNLMKLAAEGIKTCMVQEEREKK